MEESDNGKFLRTVLSKEVHNRLTEFAQQFKNGLGKWDYGVAIQMLLDFYEQNSNISQVNQKLDILLSSVYSQDQFEETDEVPKEENQGTEMLGGERIK